LAELFPVTQAAAAWLFHGLPPQTGRLQKIDPGYVFTSPPSLAKQSPHCALHLLQQFYSLRNTFMGFASAAPTARELGNVTPQHGE
jgi:hypothetical protein